MPVGVPITVAIPTMIRLPTIAFNSPPLLPGGGVIWVKIAGPIAPMPPISSEASTSPSHDEPECGRDKRQAHDDAVGEDAPLIEAHRVSLPACRSRRISSSFAAASTIKVITNRIRPSAISDDR